MNSLILLAAGQGTRMGGSINKLLMEAYGHPLIWYTFKNLLSSTMLDEIIIVVKDDEKSIFQHIISEFKTELSIKWTSGGNTRLESVINGVSCVSPQSKKLLVHDGARPFVDGIAVDEILTKLDTKHPAVIFALPSVDTIKNVDKGVIVRTEDRSKLYRAQTPQGIFTKVYKEILSHLKFPQNITDDSSLMEASKIPVTVIPGKENFFKVTTAEDWTRFQKMINQSKFPQIKIGEGYDIHRFDISRPLYLGGLKISDSGGLLGHSDADVLIHAIMDALLGAAGLPDIGHFFPDTDDRFKGVSSLELLTQVGRHVLEKEYVIGNIDSTIIAEKPKIAQYIEPMKTIMSQALCISKEQINIKATTNERLGSLGREEGIAALAAVILFRREYNE